MRVRHVRIAVLLAATFAALGCLSCSATTSSGGSPGGDGGLAGTDAGSSTGLAPGTPCLVDDAGPIPTACRYNPALPTCHQCIDLTDDGFVDAVCAYSCRMGQDDCPPGQTCTQTGSSYTTSYQPCRDRTGDVELGFCR